MIELLNSPSKIRERFKSKYLLSYDEFINAHPDVADTYAKFGVVYDETKYSESYIWDRMPPDRTAVTFEQALDMLKAMEGDVLFMSEDAAVTGSGWMNLNGQRLNEFVAKCDANKLAELIKYEWFESYKFAMQDVYFNAILPEDLYVFDESMDWVIVFTHDIDGLSTEEQMNSRYCKIYGLK